MVHTYDSASAQLSRFVIGTLPVSFSLSFPLCQTSTIATIDCSRLTAARSCALVPPLVNPQPRRTKTGEAGSSREGTGAQRNNFSLCAPISSLLFCLLLLVVRRIFFVSTPVGRFLSSLSLVFSSAAAGTHIDLERKGVLGLASTPLLKHKDPLQSLAGFEKHN